MQNTKDALGNEVEFGKRYGYSIDSSGTTKIVIGTASKITPGGAITLRDCTATQALYFSAAKKRQQKPTSSVKALKLFPIAEQTKPGFEERRSRQALNTEVSECECGGNERIAADCTMKPCKHPKYDVRAQTNNYLKAIVNAIVLYEAAKKRPRYYTNDKHTRDFTTTDIEAMLQYHRNPNYELTISCNAENNPPDAIDTDHLIYVNVTASHHTDQTIAFTSKIGFNLAK